MNLELLGFSQNSERICLELLDFEILDFQLLGFSQNPERICFELLGFEILDFQLQKG